MKLIFLIIPFLLMIASSKNSGGQSTTDSPVKRSTYTVEPKAKSSDKKKSKAMLANVNAGILKDFMRSNRILSETKITSVNIKAVRHFSYSYKHISDAKWFITEGGYLANFLSKGIYTKVVYDHQGWWLYNLLEYTEGNLDFDTRHRVKSIYYDDEILVVHHYEFDNNKTVYLIRMQDKKSNIKTIKVGDEEIKDITEREKN
jgi:hypothetical protein